MAADLEKRARYVVEVDSEGDQNAFDDVKEGVKAAAAAVEDAQPEVSELGDRFDAAREQIKAFAAGAAAGKEGLEESAAKSVFALRKLEAAAEDLRRGGRGLTDEQVKELEDLERAYKEAVRGAGEFKRAQIEATRDVSDATARTGEYAGGINSLGDIFEASGSKAAKFAGQAGAVVGALTAGYAAGTKMREGLAWIDSQLGTSMLKSLDGFINRVLRLDELADKLVNGFKAPANEAEELKNILNILEAKGIKPVSDNLEELRKQLEDVSRAQGEAGQAIIQNQLATEAWAKGLGLSREELDKSTEALAKFVEDFKKQNENLDDTALGERLKGQIEELLDGYKTLGIEAPAALQALVDQLGILEEAQAATAETADAVTQWSNQIVDSITVVVHGLDEAGNTLIHQAKITREAAAAMTLEELEKLGSPRLKEFAESARDAAKAAKLAAEQGTAAGTGLEAPGKAAKGAADELGALSKGVGALSVQQDEGAAASERQATAIERSGEAAQQASSGVSDLATAVSSLKDADLDEVARQFGVLAAAAEGLKELVATLQSVKAELADVATAARDAVAEVEALSNAGSGGGGGAVEAAG